MNSEKKYIIHERQKNIAIIHRNRGLLKVNILILGIGLALSYIGKEGIGDPIIWLGVITFAYTMVSTYMARNKLKNL